jgi:threonine dehydrogenase-like Zn-dependent dehydrogenase
MRAARYHGHHDVRVEEIPEPSLKAGQVMIAPAYVGICGSDLHEYLGGPIYIPSKHAHPLTGEKLPIVLGHEFSGIITALGDGAVDASKAFGDGTGLKIGSRVVVQPTIYDGTCGNCTAGIENMCTKGGFIGLSGGGGGLAEKIAVPVKNVLVLPEDVPMDIGALVEPLSVAWHAMSMVDLGKGMEWKDATVLVIGGGPIGIACVMVLRAKGAKSIIVSSAKQPSILKDFGANEVVSSKDGVLARVRELTDGAGVDVSVDCAGYAKGLKDAAVAVKIKGTVVSD